MASPQPCISIYNQLQLGFNYDAGRKGTLSTGLRNRQLSISIFILSEKPYFGTTHAPMDSNLQGEAIEYAWGCAKNSYRRLPLKQKQGKDSFRKAVRESISREVLTIERIRAFLRRAQVYICAYHMHHCQNEVNPQCVESFSLIPVNITKLMKPSKCTTAQWTLKAASA